MSLHANVSDAVCLVTGANTGIGRHTALELAGGGARVLLACRSREKTAPVVDELRKTTGNPRVDLLELDLGSLESVRRCAAAFYEQHDRLDLLINNAGVAGHRGATSDGFELQFGTNHIGHFALTCLLRPALLASPAPRVVTVASRGHYRPTTIDFDAVRRPTATMAGFHEYCVSKLANVLFTQELARRTAGKVGTYALHPGVVASDIWRRVPWPLRKLVTIFMVTNEEGAQTTLYCATSPEVADHSGRYYDRSREKRPSRHATPELAAELWRRSVEWTGTDWG